jgi:hypothetical protein
MDNDQESEQQIAREILQYLEEYPDAKDTLEGIAQWWLLKSLAAKKVMEVERALTFLLCEGLIIETRREGSPPLYRINRNKEKEIREMLKSE